MKLVFEPDYRSKVLRMAFAEPATLASARDVQAWRSQWMAALSSWHSPYKALIDVRELRIEGGREELEKPLAMMMTFFKGFFLKKAVGFGFDAAKGHELLPFPVHADLAAASEELGIRQVVSTVREDFRGNIQFDNHFRQHVVEINALAPLDFDSPEKLRILKDKLTNNLMQWHSAWSLLIDCSAIRFDPSVHADFAAMEKFFQGFFMKKVIGYGPKADKASYPFPVYRARHRAAAELEGEGNFSGEAANCASRKSP